jgi:hypothetical protein
MISAKERTENALQRLVDTLSIQISILKILLLTETQGPNKNCDCSSGNGT